MICEKYDLYGTIKILSIYQSSWIRKLVTVVSPLSLKYINHLYYETMARPRQGAMGCSTDKVNASFVEGDIGQIKQVTFIVYVLPAYSHSTP